jgi:hypothetical protein
MRFRSSNGTLKGATPSTAFSWLPYTHPLSSLEILEELGEFLAEVGGEDSDGRKGLAGAKVEVIAGQVPRQLVARRAPRSAAQAPASHLPPARDVSNTLGGRLQIGLFAVSQKLQTIN